MGYMDITLHGSDMASDMCAAVTRLIISKLRSELDKYTNEFNTPGPVNVALFFEERLLPGGFAKDYNGELQKLAEDTLSRMEKLYIESEKADWGADKRSQDSKARHLEDYKRLIKSLKSFISDSTFN